MNIKVIAGLVIIAVFAVWGITSFMSKTVPYVSFADVTSSSGVVQVMGKIDFDAVSYETEHTRMVFEITDLEDPKSGRRLKVIYSGVVPGNFDQATSVVAKGEYHDGALYADQLLVKCPSKYQGLEGEA